MALLDPKFSGFARERVVKFSAAAGLTEYSDALKPLMGALFPAEDIRDTIGEYVASLGLKQLRIAETEKYAHVTFFLNGGREDPFAGEDRILVPSPKIATYDQQPEMSAYEVTKRLEDAILSNKYDLIVVNYANPRHGGPYRHDGGRDQGGGSDRCLSWPLARGGGEGGWRDAAHRRSRQCRTDARSGNRRTPSRTPRSMCPPSSSTRRATRGSNSPMASSPMWRPRFSI